jgi:uncharacterized membrane protein
MIAAEYPTDSLDCHYVIRPNRSLSWRGTLIFFAVASVVTLTVAFIFALKGAWLIVPFSGLEILLLGVCLYQCARKNAECEVVHIGKDFIKVERGRKQVNECVEFQRSWSRVNLTESRLNGYPSRLTISSRGREVEIGASLVNDERLALARELQRKLAI